MSQASLSFYVSGGTLRRDAECYVHRQADEDLYAGLTGGEFCHVLTPRQMGKSSLMVRTAARLREGGTAVVVLDLNEIGQNVTVEQWYLGLIDVIGRQLNIKDALADFWIRNEKLGPLQRWMKAIREVVLTNSTNKVIIFIDEIDTVRSLPFSTDEFFAGIREFYNRRTEDPELSRLTFCLLGVVTPSTLIRDTRLTPFNIGRRIELTDFTPDEAAPLVVGLGQEPKVRTALLGRVLYWTSGHPYLTQRVCQSIVEDANVMSAAGVDQICQTIFSLHASQKDDNLMFVRNRILHSETDITSLLMVYGKVHQGKRVRHDEENPRIGFLNLSGITKVVNGYLSVRNRIYYRAFDQNWIKSNLPEEELRRQKEAYRKGIFRSATYAVAFLAMISVVVLIALQQGRLALLGQLHQPTAEAERWYQTGMSALRDGAYYQASKAFEQSIAADGEYALAHARLAEAWMELDYTDRAKDEMLRVSTLIGDRSALPQLDRLYLDAIIATVSRDFAPAIAAYSEIARLTPNQAHVYVDLGRAFENVGDSKQALESYLKATTIDTQYATAYLRAGTLYARQLNFLSANEQFDKAETIYQASGNIEGRVETLYQRGMVLIKLGKSATARGQLEQVLDLSRVIGNQFQQIKTMLQMVYVLQNEGEMAQAQKFASDAVQLAQANGMENMTARWLADLGDTFLIRGDYTEADTYYQQALDFAQRAKSRRNEARALLSLGSLRIQMSNADEAVRYVEQALPFYQQGNYQKETAQALTLLGRANRLKGDYDAALRAFYQQLQAAEQVDDLSQKSLSHEGIGTVLAQQERYPEALRHFEERYALSNKLGDQKSITYALTERGTMLWQLGRYDEAQEVLKEAFALAARPDGGNKALLATIHLVTSEMMLSQRRFTEAKAESQSAITLAGTQSTDLALQAKYVLGQALVFSGAKAEGRALCDDAVAMATKLGDAWLLTAALLALSKSLIENGEWREALNSARRAQEQFARSGQTESKWRAWLIMARASTYIGNEFQAVEQAESASHSLLDLQQQWGNDIFTRYSSRPDNQILIEQLNALKIREKALVHK